MADHKNYDPKKHVLVIGGHVVGGFADGEVITISRDEPTFKKKIGIGGDSVRTRSHNRGGRAKIKLLASSMSNNVFSGFLQAGEAGATVDGDIVTGLLKDLNGLTVCEWAVGWFEKPPDVGVADEAPDREYEIDIAELLVFVGGSVA